MNEVWRYIVAAFLGALGGALSSWGVFNHMQSEIRHQTSLLMEHRQLDGHGYVLRLLPRIEVSSGNASRRITAIELRLTKIENDRYTNVDGDRDRRILDYRLGSIIERLQRLEKHGEVEHP